MKVYFKNKLGVISTVELVKNDTIEEFVCKIQDNGDIEKVRVNMITSPGMQYKSDWFFVARYGQINAFFAV